MQTFSAESFRGSRLRLTGTVNSSEVENWAGLWMRIDGPDRGSPLAFDNMQSRPIKGTTQFRDYEVVLDVPHNSVAIAFGILLVGAGEVRLDAVRFDKVDEGVALTAPSALPTEPSNLDFESE